MIANTDISFFAFFEHVRDTALKHLTNQEVSTLEGLFVAKLKISPVTQYHNTKRTYFISTNSRHVFYPDLGRFLSLPRYVTSKFAY